MASFEEIEEYICIICRDLLLEPVVLPCKHTACLYCLEQTLDNNKYQCFICRKSIQSWYRKTRRSKGLVNEELKDKISVKFSDLFARRLNGESLDIVPPTHPTPIISSPGEIKRDFESEFAQLQQEIEKEREKEHRLSEELIKQIEEEETRLKLEEEEKLRKDEAIARELALQLEEEEKLRKDEAMARVLQFDASSSTEQNDTSMQLTLDEAFARELARKESVSSISPNMMGKPVSHFERELNNPKRLKNDDQFTYPTHFAEESRHDANLARKFAHSNQSGSTWTSKFSPKNNKLKKKQVAKYGPMDRFVETKKITLNNLT